MSEKEIIFVDFEKLIVDDVREERDSSFQELVESIKTIGLLQPVIVLPEKEGMYRVVCGRRRVRALREAGFESVPVIVHDLDELNAEMAMLSENIHRLDLGSERDAAILRYLELYQAANAEGARQAAIRKAAGMGWVDPETPEVKEALEAPKVATPIQATAKAYGITTGTVTRAVRRARGFTAEQRKILDKAKVPKADMDVLVQECEEIITKVVNLVAAEYSFKEAMTDVLRSEGRTYTGRDGSLEEREVRLAKLPARRGIENPTAFDNDCLLFWAVEEEIRKFKKAIDWNYKRESAGLNPHGLYYRRMELFLEARNPRHWTPCRCQALGADRTKCTFCRNGAYQIGVHQSLD